jgi:hypothetical protein
LVGSYFLNCNNTKQTHFLSKTGELLTKADLNGDGFDDLIIGSPMNLLEDYFPLGLWDKFYYQTGSVRVFLSSSSFGQAGRLQADDADLTLFGDAPYEWFGEQVQVVENWQGTTESLVVIGAPMFNPRFLINGGLPNISAPSAGRIYGYKVSQNLSSELLFTIWGDEKFEELGWDFACGNPVEASGTAFLAFSRPVATSYPSSQSFIQAGIVDVVELAGLKGNVEISSLQSFTKFWGEQVCVLPVVVFWLTLVGWFFPLLKGLCKTGISNRVL